MITAPLDCYSLRFITALTINARENCEVYLKNSCLQEFPYYAYCMYIDTLINQVTALMIRWPSLQFCRRLHSAVAWPGFRNRGGTMTFSGKKFLTSKKTIFRSSEFFARSLRSCSLPSLPSPSPQKISTVLSKGITSSERVLTGFHCIFELPGH